MKAVIILLLAVPAVLVSWYFTTLGIHALGLHHFNEGLLVFATHGTLELLNKLVGWVRRHF